MYHVMSKSLVNSTNSKVTCAWGVILRLIGRQFPYLSGA
jgi:hypothetical protein